MTIVSQNGKIAVNYDNVVAVTVQGAYIQAHPVDGTAISIGSYKSDAEAQQNFEDLMDSIQESEDPSVDIIYMV